MKLLPTNLGALAVVSEKDSLRYASSGVRIKTGDDGYLAEATDGRILARVTGSYPADAENYPAVPALESAPNGKDESVVPAKEWAKACKAVKKSKYKPVLENLAIVQGDSVTTFVSTDLENVQVSQPRNVEGRFAPTDEVIKHSTSGEPVVKIILNALLLAKIAKLAGEYADEDGRVHLTIYSGEKPVLVESENGNQKFRGLIMPMTAK